MNKGVEGEASTGLAGDVQRVRERERAISGQGGSDHTPVQQTTLSVCFYSYMEHP